MDVLQIDHTPMDVIVVDQQKRRPIGRPWLTLAIDVRTRMVAGFHVSLWSPSTISLSLVLSQAVLPKASWLADRELQTLDWPVHGLPRTIHVDNAKEFHAEALVRGCQEYGIRLDHRPPARPHYGGHIERLIGTMMGAVHLLPGATFSNVSEKGSYASEKRASLTLPELERWLALQIAGSRSRSPAFTICRSIPRSERLRLRPGKRMQKQLRRPAIHSTKRNSFSASFLPSRARFVETAFTFTTFATGTTYSAHGQDGWRSRSWSSTTRGTCHGSMCTTRADGIGPFHTPICGGRQSRFGRWKRRPKKHYRTGGE